MNILFLSNHLNVGGISSYLLNLGSGLKDRGHNVHIASSSGQLKERFIERGIDFIHIPIRTKSEVNPKILFSFIKLRPLLKEKDIDILHANTRVTSVLAALLTRSSGRPYILTCHGFFKPRLWRRFFPLWGKMVIAISDSVKSHLIEDFNVPQEKVKLIYSGIDLKEIENEQRLSKNEARRSLGLGDGPVVGIVARLSDIKGHKFLIEAMDYIIKKIPKAQLLIVGEGREKNSLCRQVNKLGIEKNTMFISSIEDTSSVLSAMDLFVMPSLQEGLGLSIMEAMAYGLAVVASDAGGIRDLIRDGFNGRLVKPKDVQGLYEAISQLLQDRHKARIYAINARRTIADNFSLEKMVSQTEGVYYECLNARH